MLSYSFWAFFALAQTPDSYVPGSSFGLDWFDLVPADFTRALQGYITATGAIMKYVSSTASELTWKTMGR